MLLVVQVHVVYQLYIYVALKTQGECMGIVDTLKAPSYVYEP